jgi:hypothetical protein
VRLAHVGIITPNAFAKYVHGEKNICEGLSQPL